MAQAPTYNDIRTNQQAQAEAANAAQAQQATGQQVQGEVEGNKNAILQDYMSRQINGGGPIPTDPGLGNINAPQQGNQEAAQYTMIATEVGNKSRNPQEYAQQMIALAEAGKVSTEMLRSDPVIAEMIAAQSQAPAPTPGLGQVR